MSTETTQSQTEASSEANDETCIELSHKDVMIKFQDGLSDLMQSDPLLCDLPTKISLEEVNSQIALEYGQAMAVNILRADGKVIVAVVVQNATVLDLKKAIKRQFTIQQSRENTKRCISWNYIWKRNWLYFDGQKLSQDSKPLKEYGIRNKSEVTFIKRLTEK